MTESSTGTGWSSELAAARLHVVSGKGGTGKTTVAAALALALASGGRRTLLVEVEGRQGIAQLFDTPPLPYEERKIAVAPGGGEVRALAIDAEAALLEYFEMFYRLGVAGRTLRRMGAIEFATTLAPGLRDVLLTGKVKECVTRTDARRPAGLRRRRARRAADRPDRHVPRRHHGDGRPGPQRPDPQPGRGRRRSCCTRASTAVHLVTLLEDLPVTETLETVDELAAAGLRAGAVIVNRVRPQWLPDRSVAAAADGRVDAGADPLRPGRRRPRPAVRRHRRAGRRDRRARPAHRAEAAALARLDEAVGAGPAGAAAADRRRRPGHALRAGRGAGRAGRRFPEGERVSPRTAPARLDIDALIDDPDHEVVVCCGSGGVGKTTTSAALALRAAERGRRAVVLTIDPARRLAQALGLERLDNEPGRVGRPSGRASCTR